MKTTAQDRQGENAHTVPQVTRWHIVASVLILLHVFAVWAAPFSVPPSSPLAQAIAECFRPYVEAAALNNGYRFFAPDPGPSHIVRYEVEMTDGSKRTGIFPNLKEQWPRLLYHRHMMLSARLEGPPEALWSRSYAEHLLETHEAQSVTLYLMTYDFPSPMQVQAGMKLTDPSLFHERQLIVLKRGDS